MGEITKKSNSGIVIYSDIEKLSRLNISKKQKEIFLSCRNFNKISEIQDKNTIVNSIHQYVGFTILDKGLNLNSVEELDYLKRRVVDDVLNEFGSYTLEEVRLSFYYGVRGELGEYFGINPTTFYKWLKNFKFDLLSDVNKTVLPMLEREHKNEVKDSPSKKEVDYSIAENLFVFYDEYLETNKYNFLDFGNIAYSLLKKLNLIKISDKYKTQLIKRSKQVVKDLELYKKSKNKYSLKIEDVFSKIDSEEPDYKNQIFSEAKRLALKDYITKSKQTNRDLKSQVLNELKRFYDEK